MAGHSKWANIKHRKQAVDAKKSAVFAKVSREISVLAREENNPELNAKLRKAIEKAKAAGMAKDKIQNAIDKFSSVNKESWEDVTYEGYGPSCTAFIINAITNNRNRTASELRLIFSRANGNLSQSGSVQWMFEHLGLFSLSLKEPEELIERILENLELEDLDFQINPERKELLEISVNYSDYQKLFDFFEKLKLEFDSEVSYLPKEPIKIKTEEQANLEKLVQSLEENDDVQDFHHNFIF